MITESMDIDCFIVQLSTLMSAEKCSETICHTRLITGDDDSYHNYRTRPFDPVNERRQIRSRYWVEYHSHESIVCDHQPKQLQWTKHIAGNDDDSIMSTGFDPINDRNRIPFLQVNWAWSSVGESPINDAILPLSRQCKNNKDNLESLIKAVIKNTTSDYHYPNLHQQNTFSSRRNGTVRVDALRESRQRHPGGGLLRAWRQCHVSLCISPSDRRFAGCSRSVGLPFQTNTLTLWPSVTIRRNGFIRYTHASPLQCGPRSR